MTQHYLYILSGPHAGARNRAEPIFIGTARHLTQRLSQHRIGRASVSAYRIDRLVYVEAFPTIEAATERAEALKSASREWVNALVERRNPNWRDLVALAKARRGAKVEPREKAA